MNYRKVPLQCWHLSRCEKFDFPIQESTFIEIDDISEQFNERQRNAFFFVQRHGKIKKRKYMEINRISHRIAYQELKDMMDKGLLSMVGKGRATKYVQKVTD